jgi:phenylalanyl-tRNA synthetase alpha chain
MNNLEHTLKEAREDFDQCHSVTDLDQAKAKYLGKSGVLTEALKSLGKLSAEERPKVGAEINVVKQGVEEALEKRREAILNASQAKQLAEESLDVTLPSRKEDRGSLHPVTQTLHRIESLFHSIGFSVAHGPQIESDFYNFTALNIPESHPARAMHDTFYIDESYVLRTHTSPVQIRHLEKNKPPLKIISPGRVDQQVSFADLKGVIEDFLQNFFENKDLKVRFRPSYFPFTEPSAEMDMSWKGGWLEIGGCGMVHPEVFKHVGIDSNQHQGFAFGLGVERLMMLRYGVQDLRHFFNNDLRFLQQFI